MFFNVFFQVLLQFYVNLVQFVSRYFLSLPWSFFLSLPIFDRRNSHFNTLFSFCCDLYVCLFLAIKPAIEIPIYTDVDQETTYGIWLWPANHVHMYTYRFISRTYIYPYVSLLKKLNFLFSCCLFLDFGENCMVVLSYFHPGVVCNTIVEYNIVLWGWFKKFIKFGQVG